MFYTQLVPGVCFVVTGVGIVASGVYPIMAAKWQYPVAASVYLHVIDWDSYLHHMHR